jgi:hypothetical protein
MMPVSFGETSLAGEARYSYPLFNLWTERGPEINNGSCAASGRRCWDYLTKGVSGGFSSRSRRRSATAEVNEDATAAADDLVDGHRGDPGLLLAE